MKFNRAKKRRFIIFAIENFTVFAIVIAFILLLPLVYIYDEDNLLSKRFFGNKGQYQGILTLWNIDTFEGGTASKSVFLESVAVNFEKQNKGTYIKVENMSVDQFVSSVKEGKRPNFLSFGFGLQNYLKDEFVSLDVGDDLYQNFYSSGLYDGNLKAVAWSTGAYCLISSQSRFDKSGSEYKDSLTEVAFNLDYDKKTKKSVSHISSLTFGTNNYTSTLDAFARHFSGASIIGLAENGKIDNNYLSQSTYDAYSKFIASKSSILLGSQRDVARIENKVKAGSETDVFYEPICEYSDLVNYIACVKSDSVKESVCKKFIAFMLSNEQQLKLSKIGMFSVKNVSVYSEGIYLTMQNAIQENMVIPNLFI